MPVLQYRISARVSNGYAEVLARFYSGREFSQRAKSRIFCPVAHWDDKGGQLVIPRKITPDAAELCDIQHRLDKLKDHIYNHWWREQYVARDGWLQKTIDDFNGIKEEVRKTLREVCEERCKVDNMDKGTRAQYNVFLCAIDRFMNNKPLYVDVITRETIDQFVEFFRKEVVVRKDGNEVVNRSQNTIVSKLKRFRAIMRFAKEMGYITTSPFDGYKVPNEVYGDPICLTIAERDDLYAFAGLSDRLRVQRDIFVFQCHIGCRVSDLVALTRENLDGDFLQYIAHKTRKDKPNVLRVPLSETAKEIIQRYADDHRASLLPFVHPNVYNRDIHDICQQAGLNRTVIVQDPITLQPVPKMLYEVVSSHTARRTFSQAMFRETKSERITSAFTGHADNSRAFARYAVVDDDMKQSAISKMNTPSN